MRMMAAAAITVEGLSKRYRIGALERRTTFREALMDLAGAPFRRLRSFGRSSHRSGDSIWALRDVSFQVEPGQVLGIIGKNGAGKTTLLKVLSQITDPTEGSARLRGRVASLLEVGTGFHQELTGRENVYLSGAVLGMKKREVDRRFDEIVDFAGVGQFVDTPVKRYSSGMRVRLGFAVAAFLESEILLIDEVLAVGDAEFQRKCLGQMDSITGQGRTVLFVSHNMGAVGNLCPRSLLLQAGRGRAVGESATVIAEYLGGGAGPANGENLRHSKQDARFDVVDVGWGMTAGTGTAQCVAGGPVTFVVDVEAHEPLSNMKTGVLIHSPVDGSLAAGVWSQEAKGDLLRLEEGLNRISLHLDQLALRPGMYSVEVHVVEHTRGPKAIVNAAEPLVVLASSRLESSGNLSWLGRARLIPEVECTQPAGKGKK